jgi:hypothetical protein
MLPRDEPVIAAYRVFKDEAQNVQATYRPATVNTDG